jgi:hypothetical protein
MVGIEDGLKRSTLRRDRSAERSTVIGHSARQNLQDDDTNN